MNTLASAALWSLIGLPALAGAVLTLAPRADRFAAAIGVAVTAVVAALAVVVALERPTVATPFLAGADFALTVDDLSTLVIGVVAVVALLVVIFAAADITESPARFHGLMLLFVASVMITASAATLPTLLLAWELMGAMSYALIGFHWHQADTMPAGLVAFVTTRTADLGLYLAAGAALAGGAGLALADLPAASDGWRHVIAAGVLVAALGKAAQLPFSFWLSRAMEGPSPVSALLHSAAMVAMGGYLLLRTAPLLDVTGWAGPAAAWIGLLTAVILGVVATAQRDLKQLLAASTSAQLGFVVAAGGLGAVAGGSAQLVAHAFTKAALFLAAGAWLAALGTKQLDRLGGVAVRWRGLGVAAVIAALALAGVAPLSLWATKDSVLAVALEHSPWLYGVGLLASVLSAVYAGKIVAVVARPGMRRVSASFEGAPPSGAVAPVIVLAVGAAVAGLLALPPAGTALAEALDDGSVASSTAIELTVSGVLAIAVVALVWWRGVPEPRWAAQWLGIERGVRVAVVGPTLWLARTVARADQRLDRGVEVAVTKTTRLAGLAARVDTDVVDGAVEGAAGAAGRLGALARRPQTGQLHQYYLQIVAVLVLAVVVLVFVR
ncbi:NADH-quinone oxidoreductase subunit L [Gordonia sp. HNM0687]|uniref:NADH-quinone oxidoreductase subunit L n=1 Tax=Gordonia mangrovi TaxID=2665643 RepID=A0A6L7GPP2_9ACTN|nr:proton-conducting transporter membrane subunit [Gordonia mangrovi]MXP21846.1 NADH-quinone oxidoreductase subunit L [Gordonia mangrovi]UVF76217.1 NADH-quinone oxidoreductase subunit L [Gordonia mangrovi]